MTRAVVFGATGLLGSSLCPFLAERGIDVLKVGRSKLSDHILDICDPKSIETLFKEASPEYVINLVAATDVDRCEMDVSYAFAANTRIPGAIASAIKNCPDLDLHAVHISTDQVYDGQGSHVEDRVSPVNVYGLSKYAGELLIESAKVVILRTNFYGKSKAHSRKSFSDWIWAALVARKSITVFDDVRFSALNINGLCDIIFRVMSSRIAGIYNAGCRDGISKADFALAFAKRLDLQIDVATIGRLSDLSLKAKRPLDMTMDVHKLEQALGAPCPNILDQIELTAQEYSNAYPFK